MLLNFEEIESQLNNKFSKFNGELDDLILKKRKSNIKNISSLERSLNISLPEDFLSFIELYDVDNFSMGNVSFGSGGDYLEKLFLINNEDSFNRWWVGEHRPAGIIVVAISDPYTILLDTFSGKVYAITSDSSMNNLKSIAENFSSFFRGVGSIFLGACTPAKVKILVSSEDKEFWENV